MIRAPERGDVSRYTAAVERPVQNAAAAAGLYGSVTSPKCQAKKHLLIFERAAGKIDLLSPEEHDSVSAN